MLASYPKIPKIHRPKARKSTFRLPHCHLTPPYIAKNYSLWATSSLPIVWVYLR